MMQVCIYVMVINAGNRKQVESNLIKQTFAEMIKATYKYCFIVYMCVCYLGQLGWVWGQ